MLFVPQNLHYYVNEISIQIQCSTFQLYLETHSIHDILLSVLKLCTNIFLMCIAINDRKFSSNYFLVKINAFARILVFVINRYKFYKVCSLYCVKIIYFLLQGRLKKLCIW